MINAKNGKTQGKARMAILAGTLAFSMCPVAAIAQTSGRAYDASMARPSFMQAAEQQNGDAQESGSTQEGSTQEGSTQEGSNGQQRWDARQPDGMPQGGMQGMQFDSGMPMLDGGQLPMDGDAERPGGEMMPPNGEVPEGEMPEGERPDLPEGEEPGFASGERPELPTDLNGDPNAQPTAPDGTMTQPPAKPEGDLAPELPEGEEPKLTGERPELPADADAKDDEASSATANAEKKTEKSTEKNSSKSTEKDAQANADAASGAQRTNNEARAQDNSFMRRMGDFFRSMFDWFSGTGR